MGRITYQLTFEKPLPRSASQYRIFGKSCTQFCKATVLMVDDQEFNLLALRGLLENLKIKSIDCNSGKEALEMF
jgi:response regulator RpfG family c-di-GMP phosphodiesterase